MSDALEKVSGIRQLPIFPLPLVMLPNEILPLHIFEDRYRQLLIDVNGKGGLFGVVRFEPEDAFSEMPDIGSVGCVAEIREADTLDDGRSNILTFGVVRFRIIEYVVSDAPYLVGEVEYFEDDVDHEPGLDALADDVFTLFERIAKAAFAMGDNRGEFPEIQRTSPEALSFLVTAAFNFENAKKYEFLAMTSTTERLTEIKTVLAQAVGRFEESASIQTVSKTNGHSKKKIGL